MLDQCNFPTEHQHNAGKEQTPRKEVSDKQHRCEHHKISPVKDPAVHAAPVLDDVILERAPYDHADQIAHIVEQRQQDQFFRRDNVHNIKCSKDGIKTQPH